MKKLSLKKTVITQISDQEMTKVQGGTGTDYPCPSSPGLPTCYRTCAADCSTRIC